MICIDQAKNQTKFHTVILPKANQKTLSIGQLSTISNLFEKKYYFYVT